MLSCRSIRFLVLVLASSVVLSPWNAVLAQESICVEGPLPRNEGNTLRLCSVESSGLKATIVPEGLQLEWQAPLSSESTYLGPLMAENWDVPEGDPPPGITVTGTYLGGQDRRIQISVVQIADTLTSGTIGVEPIRIVWSSVFESTDEGFLGGEFVLDESTVGEPLPFLVVDINDKVDTTIVAGTRITFASGVRVGKEWSAIFDVEDFTGYHVWRWRSDPTVEPTSWGTYNKSVDFARPASAWINVDPESRSLTYLDRDVFDGTVYHYAVTTYDEGFRRTAGTTLGIPFDSPLPFATQVEDVVRLSPVQVRVDFLRPPKEQFAPVAAVPNPYREAECDLGDFEGTCTIRFINVPQRGRLLIYTVAGDLVQEILHDDPNSGTVIWNLRNGRSQKVASGVYIYKIIDLLSGEESFGRLAVIR